VSVDDVLVALADPTRRQLLDVLAELGQASATTLGARLPVTRQAVMKHLLVLEQAGLVSSRRDGRQVLYQVESAPLEGASRYLAGLASVWDRRLAALKRTAETTGG
jgi:DNA-binding transcriptional ArsR family regulator